MLKKIILAVLIIASSLTASEIKWAKDFESGIKESTKINKPVLFVFSRHSCHYCKLLDET